MHYQQTKQPMQNQTQSVRNDGQNSCMGNVKWGETSRQPTNALTLQGLKTQKD